MDRKELVRRRQLLCGVGGELHGRGMESRYKSRYVNQGSRIQATTGFQAIKTNEIDINMSYARIVVIILS